MISILIVNHAEQDQRLLECLESIRQRVAMPSEIILVETFIGTGPSDQQNAQAARHDFAGRGPSVNFLRAINLSFAGACNFAAQHASGEYLLLLSSDAVLQTDIADAVKVLERDSSIGAVGAEKYNPVGDHRVSCAYFPTPIRLWRFSSMWHIPTRTWKHIDDIPVRLCDYVDISFLLTRATAWRAVRGMDERNRVYGDEMDYCRALLDQGLLTVHCPTVRYAHGGEYSAARLGHLIGGFRRYHRRFSGPITRLQAEIALRAGLALRIPFYWLKSRRGDAEARTALRHTLDIYQRSKGSGAP